MFNTPTTKRFWDDVSGDGVTANVAIDTAALNTPSIDSFSAHGVTWGNGIVEAAIPTSLLPTPNSGGVDTSGAGNAASLDTDSGLNPTLLVNAANPADVIFTVSGLDNDYSGTVTFTDSTGKSDVVPIGSDGTYSTNLSNLTNGTITYIMKVSDPAGNVITVDPAATLGDGSANAPAGSPQLPNLLSSYAVRPPWEVAGVDYAVGYPAGTALKDPNQINIPGVTVVRSTENGGSSTIGNYLMVTGNNVVLNGYNFALEGGWQVDVTGNNATIENSYFLAQSTALSPIRFEETAVGGNVLDNTINGNSTNDLSGDATAEVLIIGAGGTFNVEYNYIYNSWGHMIDVGGASDTITPIIEYNVFKNTGISPVQHGDFIFANTQTGSGTGTVFNDMVVDYNTFDQPDAPAGGGTQGIVLFGHVGSNPTFINPDVSYNEFIAPTPSSPLAGSTEGVDPWIQMGSNEISGTGTVTNNYVDPSGNLGTNGVPGLFLSNVTTSGSLNGTIATSNNVNMLTGGQVISQTGTSAPAAPIMVSENIIGNRVVLTGTAAAGDIVSVYDGTKLLGTASSNSQGNWVFVTPAETDGAHTFTATATDATGKVSALSNGIDPDVGAVPTVNAAPVEVGNQYYLYTSSGSYVTLSFAGAIVTAGKFGSWTPIGAVQTATGYDVAWKITGANEYTVWSTNSSGNAIANLTGGPVSGTSYALESLESNFNQDLNGDGVIGLTTTLIQIDGSTSLNEVANRFYLDGIGGSGPALQYAGADVTAGEFGGWTPIGAVQTAAGYDVAWKMAGANEYTVWATNSSGNAIANLTGAVSGTSTALELLESTFNQDLNGDRVIGLYAAPGTAMQINTGISGPATIGASATLELVGADTGSVTFSSSKGVLILDHSSTFGGQIFNFTGNGSLSGSDQIDLRDINYNSVQYTYANGVLTVTDGTDISTLKFNGSYSLANFKLASDGSGGTIIYDPPVPNFGAESKTAADSGSPSVTDAAGFGSTVGADTSAADHQNSTGFGGPPVSDTTSVGVHNTHGYGGSTVIDPPLVDAASQSNVSGSPSGSDDPAGLGSPPITEPPPVYPQNSIGFGSPVVTDTASVGLHNSHGYGGSTVIDPPLVGAASQSNASGSPSGSDPTGFGGPPATEPPPPSQDTAGFGSPAASDRPPVSPQNPTGLTFLPVADPQNGTNSLSMPAFGAATTLGYLADGNTEGAVLATNDAQGGNIALLANYMASSFAMASNNSSGTMGVDGALQPSNQALLTNPQHT